MILRRNTALTLAEVLLAVFILSVGIASTLLFFSRAMISTRLAADITTATSHAEYLLEEMQTRKTLSEILGTDWVAWAGAEELNTLPNETVDVRFSNALVNPLDIQATVSWMRELRNYNLTLSTKITR